MKFNMTLGKQITAGIVVMLFLRVMLGPAGFYGLTSALFMMSFNNTLQVFKNLISSVKEQPGKNQ